MDLSTLAYPRHLHKPLGQYLRVESVAEATEALADGWTVDLLSDEAYAASVSEPPAPDQPATKKGKKATA